MISTATFLGMVLLLIFEGWLLLGLLGNFKYKWLRRFLALPTATCMNVFLFAVATVGSVPLSPAFIIGSHIGIIVFVLLISFQPFFKRFLLSTRPVLDQVFCSRFTLPYSRIAMLVCSVVLAVTFTYSFTHAVILPTYHYDSATNWNMRSKLSFYDQKIILKDPTGIVRKPHYPFLYHSLQLAVHAGQQDWNDRAANTIHFLLSLTSLSALLLLLRILKGSHVSLLCLASIVGTPLFAMHLGQSYADITLVQYALLSLASLLLYKKSLHMGWLMLSAIFVSACTWTKTEGLFFCFIPWILILATEIRKPENSIKDIILSGIVASFLSLLWPAFAMLKGIALTPHGESDMQIEWSTEAIVALKNALFVQGSFGVVWYGIILSLCIMIVRFAHPSNLPIDRTYFSGMLWGLLALAGYMFVYLFTSNAAYLIDGQSFDRQLLLPTSLIILSLILCLTQKVEKT